MSQKTLIIGGNAGGATTAARLRRLDEEAEIIIFERGEHVSWANCGLPYYVGDVIKSKDQLVVKSQEEISQSFDLDIRTNNEVISIKTEDKKIVAKNENGETYTESYDNLVLSPGAKPVKPPIDGLEKVKNLFTLRKISDAETIKKTTEKEDVEKALIVGGGFIGLEMTENLQKSGLKVTLVEMLEQVMPALDREMAAMVQNHLRRKGVDLFLENSVTEFKQEDGKTKALLQNGEEIETDLVIIATGVKPEIELGEKAGLEIGDSGGIKVNEYLETSESDIFAIGDVIEVRNCVTGNYQHIPLAGPANKQGRIVANNISGLEDSYDCSLGTFVAKVFDLTVGCTGTNEKALEEANIDYEKSYTFSQSHVTYYPGASPMWVKLLFDPEMGEIYGSQIIGRDGVDKRIDVLSTSIQSGNDVFDLQELDLAYAPPYSAAKDPVNMAGYVAGNIINDIMDIVHWHELESLDPDETLVLDVRTELERSNGHISGSKHIPLSELRERLDELPEDKTIVSYCAIGLRSYIATRILLQNGFDAKDISGGYGIYSAVKRDEGEELPPISCSIE